MMDIDIQRLKTDAAYWDEVAPEDATAAIQNGWVKYDLWLDGKSWFWWPFEPEMEQAWQRTLTQCDSYHEPFIPRPAKPAAPEWDGEGKPPVGLTNKQFTLMTHISVACNENPETEYEVVAHMFGKVIVAGKTHGRHFAHIVPATACKPIRTKEQRERDELIELAFSTVQKIPSTESAITAVVDAIIAAGWTKL